MAILAVALAGLLFVGTHLGLSSTSLRSRLVTLLGERGFLGFYTVLALLVLVNLVRLYAEVPRHEYVWLPDPWLSWVPKIVLPFAFMLATGAFIVTNPTSVGAQAHALAREPVGVLRITRHPLQWALALWALTHIVANGDAVSIVFFASFATLSIIGSFLIDRKKAAAYGAEWQTFCASTSNLPFAAIVVGRNRLVAKELLAPAVVGLVIYALVFWFHPWVSGVRII